MRRQFSLTQDVAPCPTPWFIVFDMQGEVFDFRLDAQRLLRAFGRANEVPQAA